MGNTICFDVEEFYFKFSFALDKKPQDSYNISKHLSCTVFQAPNLSFLFGKILLTDITDTLLNNEEELKKIKKFVEEELIKQNEDELYEINVTGSGFDIYKEEINIFFGKFIKKYTFHKQKLIKCIAQGIKALKSVPDKHFFYSIDPHSILHLNNFKEEDYTDEKKKYTSLVDKKEDIMVVNIRSGVSYYQVSDELQCERVSGSIIGESTFASLIRLLAGYENCMEALDEGMKGDLTAVDMTVGDIYGGNCADLGLPDTLLASSMGKAQYIKETDKIKPRDLAKSIIVMFAINIGMMTNLVADSVDLKTVIIQGFPHLGFQALLSVSFFCLEVNLIIE